MRNFCISFLLCLVSVLAACRTQQKVNEVRTTQADRLLRAASLSIMDTTWLEVVPGMNNLKVTMGEAGIDQDLEKDTPGSKLQVVHHAHVTAADTSRHESTINQVKEKVKPAPRLKEIKLEEWPLVLLTWCMAGGIVVIILLLIKLIREVR